MQLFTFVSFVILYMNKMPIKCPSCEISFSRKDNLKKHFALKHSGSKNVISCFLCGLIFKEFSDLDDHHENNHRPSSYFEIKESAFQKTAICYRYIYEKSKFLTLSMAQNEFIKKEMKKIIRHETAKKNTIKYSIIFIADLNMFDNRNNIISKATIPFRSQTFTSAPIEKGRIKRNINFALEEHANRIESFINNGSNWVFNRPLAMDVEICGVNAMFVGSNKFCSLNLEKIPNKKHLINVPSKKDKCLLYCIAEALYGKKITNKKTVSEYKKYVQKFNIAGINFPTSIKDVRKFVSINPNLDIKINILFYTDKKIFPIESAIGTGKKIVNLLVVSVENELDKSKSCFHFLLITNLDKFLSKIYKNENGSFYQQIFYCSNCLNKFYRKETRDEHYEKCILNKAQIEKVPDITNNIIKFVKYENQFKNNLVGYLDFESALHKIDDVCESCATLRCKCNSSYTRFENIQKAICFSFIIINKENAILYEKTYSGENAGDVFLDDLLLQEKLWIKKYLHEKNPMTKLTNAQELLYNNSEKCYMCDKAFTVDDYKVRDHDHFSGLFVGPAHNSCNLRRRKQKHLKIYLHNGAKYDFKFLVKSLAKKDFSNLYILPYNMENFRLIKFNSFMFLDSLAFLPSSLSKLCDDLKASNHDYPILRKSNIVQTNGFFDAEKFDMVLQKGFFCYDYW